MNNITNDRNRTRLKKEVVTFFINAYSRTRLET